MELHSGPTPVLYWQAPRHSGPHRNTTCSKEESEGRAVVESCLPSGAREHCTNQRGAAMLDSRHLSCHPLPSAAKDSWLGKLPSIRHLGCCHPQYIIIKTILRFLWVGSVQLEDSATPWHHLNDSLVCTKLTVWLAITTHEDSLSEVIIWALHILSRHG